MHLNDMRIRLASPDVMHHYDASEAAIRRMHAGAEARNWSFEE
jgi:hypothetical protein